MTSATNLNNFINKYVKTPLVNNIINVKGQPDSQHPHITTDHFVDVDTDKALEMDDIRYSPVTTECEEYDDLKDMCVICGEIKCICYEVSMDEINAQDEAIYISSLGPHQRKDYENHKKMEEFLRIYCGR